MIHFLNENTDSVPQGHWKKLCYIPPTLKKIKNGVGREKRVIWWSKKCPDLMLLLTHTLYQTAAQPKPATHPSASFPSSVQKPAPSGTDAEYLSHFSGYCLAVLSTAGKSIMFSSTHFLYIMAFLRKSQYAFCWKTYSQTCWSVSKLSLPVPHKASLAAVQV